MAPTSITLDGIEYWYYEQSGSSSSGSVWFTFYFKELPAVTPVSYTVTFDANGHGTAPAAQTIESGKTATKPDGPTETGWTFGGWYTEAACTTAFDFSTPITGNITLYAKWTEESVTPVTYKVSFDANGGSGSYGPIEVEASAEYTAPDITEVGFTAPEGKEFSSWRITDALDPVGVEVWPGD